ncbi:hypothetical protein LXL04_005333 [Taraxacum kok-saghyz]
MASIIRLGGRLFLALFILIIITTANARNPYNHVRQLATDCNSPIQSDIPGCGGGGGGSKPEPCGSARGLGRCKNGCCGVNTMGYAICC